MSDRRRAEQNNSTKANRLNPTDIDIVVVSYNSVQDLNEMWMANDLDESTNVIVVDNGSQDSSASVALQFADRVVRNTNEGLSKANNKGARQSTSEYIIFCNPDARLTLHAAQKLREVVEQTNGIVAPRLVGRDGQLQPNGRSFPSPFRQVAHRLFPTSRITHRYLWPEQAGLKTDWVTGAVVAMARSHFETLGGWPEQIFLYFEDVEICAQARAQGIPVTLSEDIQVTHSWAKESGTVTSKASRQHVLSAIKYYTRHPRHLFLL